MLVWGAVVDSAMRAAWRSTKPAAAPAS